MIDILVGYEMFLGGAWVDVTDDVRAFPAPRIRHGIPDITPKDRMAETGSLTLNLDNSTANSGGKLGYYSPDHANCRADFGLGTRIRWWIKDSGGTKRYKFHGRIISVVPSFGLYRERQVEIQAVDYIEYVAQTNLSLLPVQLNKRVDEVIATIIAALPIAPLATSYAQSPNILAYALHADLDEKTTAQAAIQKCLQSDLGYFFIAGDNSGGEVATYQSRYSRHINPASGGTFNDSMIGLEISRETAMIFNDVRVTTNPIRLDPAGTTVLATAQTEFSIPPGGTIEPVFRYRDPTGNERVSGLNMITPVAGTDFCFTATPNSGGSDLNSAITLTPTFGANSARIRMVNGGAQIAYGGGSERFQLRGQAVYLYDPVDSIATDTASGTTYGVRTLQFSMPYQSDFNVGAAFATELLARYKAPFSKIRSISIAGNVSAAFQDHTARREIGDRITVIESVTGISKDFFINSIEYEMRTPRICFVTWLLEPVANLGKIGMWGTNAGDSGVWGSSSADATDWVF